MNKTKKVLAFGTFDIFHKGHEFYLREARKHGNTLNVVVARDSTVKQIKGKFPLNNESKRLAKIKSLDYVNNALLGHEDDKYKIIEESSAYKSYLYLNQGSFIGFCREGKEIQ